MDKEPSDSWAKGIVAMSEHRLKYPLDDIDPILMPGVNPNISCIYIFFVEEKGC